MCRFKWLIEWLSLSLVGNFNTSYVSVQEAEFAKMFKKQGGFQYILCVGSSIAGNQTATPKDDFNTSYVSVQVSKLTYVVPVNEFQYILCVGSRKKCT